MAIVRWDPFRTSVSPRRAPRGCRRGHLQTGDHELVLKAELPDMTREDIDINIENFVLTIKGEKKLAGDVKEEQFHHVERRYGTFTRSFSLPTDCRSEPRARPSTRTASLTVRLPLREEAKPRSIKVGVAA